MGSQKSGLRVVENLQLDHGWRSGPRPADDVLGALAQVHDQHPDDHEPPAHQGVQVPDPEGEEQYVKEFVAQLRAEAEQVVERPGLFAEGSGAGGVQTAKASRKPSSLSGKESAQGCLPKRLLGRPD